MESELIMLVGLPACGKSTYAEKLKEKGYKVHSSDALREELLGDVNSQEKNADIFVELHRRIKADLQRGFSCVYDATNMNKKTRIVFLQEIKKIDCKKTCVLFVVPVSVCKERNQNRERKVPDYVYDKMLKSFWCPYYYEGWDEIRFNRYNGEFIEPWMEEDINIKQDNPHHTLTLGEHLFKTAGNELIIRSGSMALLMAAFHHDIGKLFTKTFKNYKGETTNIAHYYQHENYGTYMYLCMSEHSYQKAGCTLRSDKKWKMASDSDTLREAVLINWHMRPYVWERSEKPRECDRQLIGEELYNEIMLLHEADVAAH